MPYSIDARIVNVVNLVVTPRASSMATAENAPHYNPQTGKAEFEIMLTMENISFIRDGVLQATDYPESHGSKPGVPMKLWEPNHLNALDGFTRAFIAGTVTGKPDVLIRASMEMGAVEQCRREGKIDFHNRMKTAKVMETMIPENYPTLELEVKGNSEGKLTEAFDDMLEILTSKKQKLREDRAARQRHPASSSVQAQPVDDTA